MHANYPYVHAPRLPEDGAIDPRQIVGHGGQAVELEIGPGRGGFVFERLAADPSIAIVGLEIRRKWATLTDERLVREGLSRRARVFAEDATAVLPRFVDGCLSHIYVHFPDPWWKKRHAKRLVVTERLLDLAARLLIPGGQILIQTDVAERGAAYEQLLRAASGFEPVHDDGRVADNPFGARSPREHRAIADGLPVTRLLYQRRS